MHVALWSTLLIGPGVIAAGTDAGGFLRNGVTAHRGFSGRHPENTLEAFRAAIELGVDWIELDVFRTGDGKIVVTHDKVTNRQGDVALPVPGSTYEALRGVDVATGFRKKHGLTLADCPAATMPLLEDVLRLVMTQSRTRVSIQSKQDIIDDIIAVVRALGARKWVGFNENSLARLRRVKELEPGTPVFYDTHGKDTAGEIEAARTYGFETIVVHEPKLTREAVDAIHAAALEVGVWVVNDPTQMNRFLDWGVDRVYTDFPDELLRIKRRDGRD